MVAALIPTPRSRCTSSRPRPRYKPTTRKRVGRRWPTRSDLAKPSASFLSWLRGKHLRRGGQAGRRASVRPPLVPGVPVRPRFAATANSLAALARVRGPVDLPIPPRNWASRCTISALVRAGARAPAIAGRWWCWHARVLRLRQRVCGRSGRSGGSTRGVPRCVGTGWPGVGGRGVLRRRVHPSGERGIDRSGPGPQRPGDRPVWACGHRGVVDGGTSATVRAVPRLR